MYRISCSGSDFYLGTPNLLYTNLTHQKFCYMLKYRFYRRIGNWCFLTMNEETVNDTYIDTEL